MAGNKEKENANSKSDNLLIAMKKDLGAKDTLQIGEELSSQIKQQVRLAMLNQTDSEVRMNTMKAKYGLTGGEAATVDAGMDAARSLAARNIEAQLTTQTMQQLKSLTGANGRMPGESNPVATNGFADYLTRNKFMRKEDISESTMDLYEALGLKRSQMDSIINILYGDSGDLDTKTYDEWVRKSSDEKQTPAK